MLRRTVTALEIALSFAQGLFQENVGEGGDFGSSFSEGSDLQRIAQEDADVLATLETREQERDVSLEAAGTEASEVFLKLLAGKTLIEIFIAQKSLQEVGIADKCLAEKSAVAEDDDSIMGELRMLVEEADGFRRGFGEKALEKRHGGVRVRRFIEGDGECGGQRRGEIEVQETVQAGGVVGGVLGSGWLPGTQDVGLGVSIAWHFLKSSNHRGTRMRSHPSKIAKGGAAAGNCSITIFSCQSTCGCRWRCNVPRGRYYPGRRRRDSYREHRADRRGSVA